MTQDRNPAGERGSAGEEPLSEAFWSVASRLREISKETLAPWDITPGQLRALRVLKRHGPMRLSELSDHLHIAPRSTTEVVDALEARDLIQRRPDPSDRRATLVELTEHGASVLDAIRAPGEPTPSRSSAASARPTAPISPASCACSQADGRASGRLDQAAVDEVVGAGDVKARSEARNVINVATSSGVVNRPVANPPMPAMIFWRAVSASTPLRPGHGRGHAVLAEPQVGRDRARGCPR